jgi:hypothetical protein
MKDRIIVFLFMITLIGIGSLNMIWPSEAKISELENRKLATFPILTKETFFSGDFFSGIENYYADHLFQRDNFVFLSQQINALKGIRGKDKVELISMGSTDEYVINDEINEEGTLTKDNQGTDDSIHGSSPKGQNDVQAVIKYQEVKRPISTANDLNQRVRNYARKDLEYFADLTPIPPISTLVEGEIQQHTFVNDEALVGGRKNGLLVIGDTCYEVFGYDEKSCAYYANSINSFQSLLPESAKVYSIVVPSHIEFVQSEKYRKMAMSQVEAINIINENLNDSIRKVNIYSSLAEHANEYLYFRSDHHWTALGAYYAYTAFATAIGDKPYDLTAFEQTTVEGFLGTLYQKSLSKEVKSNPDVVQIFMPFVENKFTIYTSSGSKLNYDLINMKNAKISNKYLIFISGDNPLSIIDTQLDNGKKIMVFKDSYGNAFLPFLTSHYDEIHIIDPRHYSKGAITYAKEQGIDEFLFINSATLIAGNKGFARNIYKVSY